MFNKGATKYYLRLLALSLFFIILIIITGMINPSGWNNTGAILLTIGFTLAALSSLLLFFRGFYSDSSESVFLTLIALGLKMLVSFVLALLYFLVFKNLTTGSVVLFFVLYLAFTVYVVLTFTSVLKKKSD
jgi:hypothetical protein